MQARMDAVRDPIQTHIAISSLGWWGQLSTVSTSTVRFDDYKSLKNRVSQACKWLQTATIVLHEQQRVVLQTAQILQYVRSYTAVWYVQYNADASETLQTIRRRFACQRIVPNTYTWDFHHSELAVYFKFSFLNKHSYVGMTAVNVTNRERTRLAKHKQVDAGKLVSCEPAVRYWQKHQSLHHYVIVVVANPPTITATLAMEARLIATWQPSLNMPHIITIENKTALGNRRSFRAPTFQYPQTHKRLWKKVRRRLRNAQVPIPGPYTGTSPKRGMESSIPIGNVQLRVLFSTETYTQ